MSTGHYVSDRVAHCKHLLGNEASVQAASTVFHLPTSGHRNVVFFRPPGIRRPTFPLTGNPHIVPGLCLLRQVCFRKDAMAELQLGLQIFVSGCLQSTAVSTVIYTMCRCRSKVRSAVCKDMIRQPFIATFPGR
jgi:hypothetical protein